MDLRSLTSMLDECPVQSRRFLSLSLTLFLALLASGSAWASGDTTDSGDGATGPGTETAQQNFFRDEYTVDVDPSSGSFQTSIPIKVPPFHGIEPTLSLDYSSSAGNGFVGVGWRLSGLSKIERITPGRGTPTYTSTDTYALDGEEMVVAASGNCSNLAGDYCTRIQNFKRIEQSGSNWVVTEKDGTKATYTPQIQAGGSTFRWNVSTVVDTHGNTVNYSYACETSTSDCYPNQVTYNGGKVVVTFVRENRGSTGDADPVTFATGRSLRTMSKRLSEIQVGVNGSQARRYRLVYLKTTNGERSKLDKIELRRNAALFPADQEFDYEDGAAIAWTRNTYSHNQMDNLNFEYLTGDFNGDGRTDYFVNPDGGNVTNVYTYLSNGDGSYTSDPRPISGTPYANQTAVMGVGHWLTADVNGDGFLDVVHALTGGTNGTLRVWLAVVSGTSFSWDVDDASWSCSCQQQPIDFTQGRWSSGDFNGDGLTDLVQISRTSKKAYVWKSNGDTSFDVSELDSGQPFVGGVGSLLPVDLNGDGNTDFVHIYNHSTTAGSVHWWISDGNLNFTHDSMPRPVGYPVALNVGRWRTGDFNGDGQADLLHAATGSLNIWFSHGGDDFTTQTVTIPGSYPDLDDGWLFPINLNGDDRTDLLHVTGDASPTLELWQSTDAPGFFVVTSEPKPGGFPTYPGSTSNWTAGKWQIGDTDGDGRDDLYHFTQHDTDNVRTWRDLGVDGNRLTDFTNRTGGTTSVAYTPSSAWPRTGFLPVGMIYQTVTSVTTNDGRSNTHQTRYEYEDALWSKRERCFLGFGTVRKFLDINDNYEDIRIRQVDNCTNKPQVIYKREPDASGGKIFSYTEFEYDEEVTTPPYRALENRRNEHECNLINATGSGCRQVRTEWAYNNYGDVTRTIEYGLVSHGGADPPDERTTFDTFFPNATLYIVDRVAQTRIYSGIHTSAPAGDPAAETRFVYDNPGGSYTDQPTKGDLRVRKDWDSFDDVFRDTTFSYYTNGNLQQELNPLSRGKSFTYDSVLSVYPEDECPVPAVIACTTTLWDAILGVPTSVTDPNSALTIHAYDTWGRLDLTTYDDGSFTDYVYSGEGSPPNQKVEIFESDHTADDLLRTVYVDGFGREWKTEREGGDTKTTEYHENSDRIEFESVWFNANDGETAAEREFQYDGAERLVQVVEPYTDPQNPGDDVFWTVTYNAANDGSSTRTDALGKKRTTFVDGLGRTIRVREHDGPSALYDTEYRYDVLDQLTLVQDSLASQTQDASFVVDSLGKTRTSCDFDIDQSQCRVFTYYADGQLWTETNARGQATTLTYDGLGRVKTKTTAEGEVTTWFYDEAAHGASQGRLTRVTYPSGRQEFSWDSLGFRTGIAHCVSTGSKEDCRTVSQAFVDRRLTSMTYPNADGTTETLTYGYDAEGFVSSVSGLVSNMTHDARGRVTTITYASGGVSTVLNHDYPQDVLGDMAVSGPGGSIYQANYGYDAGSQVKSLTGTVDSLTFLYDDLYRLTTVAGTGGSPSQSFAYDRIGRLTTRDGITYDYDHAQHPHAVSGADGKSYAYDPDGNLTSVTTKSSECVTIDRLHHWDSENRLRWVSDGTNTTRYVYDHQGQRISKSGPAGKANYYGNLLELRDPTGTPVLVKYYYVDGMLLAMDEAGAKQWVHTDHLDSVRAISNATTGLRTVAYQYAAYGEEIGTLGSSSNVRSFGGHWKDNESALLYMGARYHDPVLARFIQPDPIVPEPGDPQSWNRYSFVRNNPLNRIDPTGRRDVSARQGNSPTRLQQALAASGTFTLFLFANDVTGIGVVDDVLIPFAIGTTGVIAVGVVVEEAVTGVQILQQSGREKEEEEDEKGFEDSLRDKTEREKGIDRQKKQDAREKTGRELLEDADAIRKSDPDPAQEADKMRQRGRKRLETDEF